MRELPLEFQRNMEEMLGPEAEEFFSALSGAPALALRLNPNRRGASDAAARFSGEGVPWEPLGRYLLAGQRPGKSIEHFAGAFYLQEASAMAPARALGAIPGDRVLDLCAAPGGKSGQIAAMLAGEGALVANEIDFSRAKALAANLERLGITNAAVCSEHPRRLAERWPEAFDKVLVDAPCSGEGMFRREETARQAWTPEAPSGCAGRQREILECAARMLRPGGRMVYSTCTFNTVENERVMEAFLKAHEEFFPENFSLPGLGESKNGMLRIWPNKARGDGHFVCRLKKRSEAALSQPRPSRPPEALSALKRLAEAIALPEFLLGRSLKTRGKWLYALPPEIPPLENIRVVSPGLAVLRIERNRVEPEHALAMALNPALAGAVELEEAQAARFLAGEAIALSGPKGWALAAYHGLPLGWGKFADGFLKNHIPKGLRPQIL